MNQKERNELSRARILVHASAEFAEHGYHGASVNRICENENLKGSDVPLLQGQR